MEENCNFCKNICLFVVVVIVDVAAVCFIDIYVFFVFHSTRTYNEINEKTLLRAKMATLASRNIEVQLTSIDPQCDARVIDQVLYQVHQRVAKS
jgi:hypothetical protein